MYSGFPKDNREIENIWNWFYDQQIALIDYRYKTIEAVLKGSPATNKKFTAFLPENAQTIEELDKYFDQSEKNLEHLVCFDLISAAEAFIRLDYISRKNRKKRTMLAKVFLETYKRKGNRASLEEDILEEWKSTSKPNKQYFSDFIGLLNYRNWLAHGRYWDAMLGEKYTPERTYKIIEKVRTIIQANS